MAVSGKTKKELIEEINVLKSHLKELEHSETERKKAQEESKKSKEFLDNVINALDDSFFVKDQDHRWVMLNDRACELIGRRREELIGKSDHDLFPKEQADVFWEGDDRVFETGRTNVSEEAVTWRSKVHTISTKKSLYTDPVTSKKFITGTSRDITERKKIEEALRESEFEYRTTLDSIWDSIHVVDADLRIILMNEKFLKWAKELDIEIDRPIGRNIFDLFPFLPDKVRDEYRKIFETGEALTTIESTQIAGREIFTESRKIPFFEADKVVKVITIIRDITARKLAEEKVRFQSELLDSISKAQSEYITQGDPQPVFDMLLETLVSMTDSEYGFLDEVCRDEEGQLFKKSLSISDISWDDESRKLYEQLRNSNLEFGNLNNLAGAPALTGELIITNDAKNDPYSGGLPKGHPPISSYMGIPMFFGGEFLGIAGVANRHGGYTKEIASSLEAFISTCAGIIHAIRENKKEQQIAEELQQSEKKFRSYIENAPDGVLVVDKTGRYLEANEAASRIIGYSKEELLEMSISDTLAPESQQAGAHHFGRVVNEGYATGELTYLCKDGSRGFWSVDAVRISEDRFLGFIKDVTEQKKAEEALRKSEELARACLNATNDMVYLVDTFGNVFTVNDIAARQLGKSPDELIGKNIFSYFSPDVAKLRKEYGDKVISSGKNIRFQDEREGKFFDISIYPTFDSQKKVDRLAVFVTDITEQKKTQAALSESELRFRKFFENEPEYCYMISPEGTIFEANSAALNALGYAKEELIGKPLESLYAPESHRKAHQLFEQWKRTGEIRNEEMVIITSNGDRRIVLLSSAQVLSEDGKLLHSVSIQRDITERKKAQEKMKKNSIIINSTTDSVITTDIDGNITSWNKGAEIIYGYLKDEVIGKPISILYKEQDLRVLEAMIECLLDGKELSSLEVTNINKNKKEVEILLSLTSIRDEFGNIIELVGITKDITEYKKAREALRQSEEKFRSMFELSPYATFLSDLKGNIIACNRQFTKLHGTKEGPDAQVGRNVSEFFPEEDRLRLSSLLKNKAEGRRTIDQFEYTMLREDGTKFLAETKSAVILDKDGEPQALIATAHDITERKLAEERLRQSEEKFKVLFELAPDAYYIHDLEGKIIDGNKAAEKLIGFGKEEVIGKNYLKLDLISEEDIPKEISAMAESVDSKPVGPLEMTFNRKDGSKVIVETRSYPVEISGQTVVLGIARDITERRGLEEAYRSLVDNSLQGLTIVQDGRMVFFNRAFSSTTGYTEQELLDASPEQIRSLVHPEDRELVWKRHRDRLAGKPVPPRYEFRWMRKDGGIAWVEIFARQIEYQGRPAIQSAYIDITDRKNAEQAHRQSEERLKILFESAPDAIYVLDLKGSFVDVNKATEQLTGYSKAELIGKSFFETDLLCSEHMLKKISNLEKIAIEKPTGPDEFTFTRKDGSSVPVEISNFPVRIEDRLLALAVARDVTERKMTEKKLIEHQKQLKSLASELSLTEERERHRLATNLHDQISQALVFSRIKLQQLHASVSSEEIAGPLEEACNNLDRIIQDTRTLTFDLSSPILYELGFEAAVSEWLEEQVGKKYDIKTSFEDDGLPKPLEDDIRVLLFRNVRELLVNIIKHANARNVKISISRINDQICVFVQDDGVGFNPAEVESKAGFGIFSIRERLELLAGHFDIESEPGRGTRISMTAPLNCNEISKQNMHDHK